MGAVYTRTTSGAVLRDSEPERQTLLDEYFVPYAAIASLVRERWRQSVG